MTEPKPLTYDEHRAAEAAFRGYPPDADWTDSAQEMYVRLSAAIAKRRTTALNLAAKRSLEEVLRQVVMCSPADKLTRIPEITLLNSPFC
jgi:hypothetical protein